LTTNTRLTSPVPWNRRTFLRTAGLAGLGLGTLPALAACGDDEPEADELASIRVALGWISNVEFAGFWIADDRGYYAEENLEVEFLGGGPNAPDPTQQLASGSVEIGVPVALQMFLQAVHEGNDFVTYGAMFQSSPAGFLSLADKPILAAEDLVGATILGQQGVQPFVEAALRVNGLPVEYDFIPVGFEPSPLVEGQGDVYTCFVTNQPISLETEYGMVEGEDYFTVTYEDLGMPSYAGMVCSQRSYLEENRGVVERFMRATVRGWQDNNSGDPAAAAQLATEKYGADLGLDVDQQTRENELQIPLTESDLTRERGLFRIDTELMSTTMYEALRAAEIADLPDVGSIVDELVLDNVFDGKATV
jgi:ABC-type nitrate/sulfonate/bicarbonate transport system substrate-binding protein